MFRIKDQILNELHEMWDDLAPFAFPSPPHLPESTALCIPEILAFFHFWKS